MSAHITQPKLVGIKRNMGRRVVAMHGNVKSVGTHPKHHEDAARNRNGRQVISDANAFAPINSSAADRQAATYNSTGGKY